MAPVFLCLPFLPCKYSWLKNSCMLLGGRAIDKFISDENLYRKSIKSIDNKKNKLEFAGVSFTKRTLGVNKRTATILVSLMRYIQLFIASSVLIFCWCARAVGIELTHTPDPVHPMIITPDDHRNPDTDIRNKIKHNFGKIKEYKKQGTENLTTTLLDKYHSSIIINITAFPVTGGAGGKRSPSDNNNRLNVLKLPNNLSKSWNNLFVPRQGLHKSSSTGNLSGFCNIPPKKEEGNPLGESLPVNRHKLHIPSWKPVDGALKIDPKLAYEVLMNGMENSSFQSLKHSCYAHTA